MSDVPIASVKNAFEDQFGLFVEGEFHSTDAAQAVRKVVSERMARGRSVKASFAYVVKEDDYVNIDDPVLNAEGITKGRLLKKLDVLEAGIVNLPAQPIGAEVVAVKQYLATLGTKEGRAISTERRSRLAKIADDLDGLSPAAADIRALLAETEPGGKALDREIAQIFERFYMRKHGIPMEGDAGFERFYLARFYARKHGIAIR